MAFNNKNFDYLYSDIFRKRNLRNPLQYASPKMRFPTEEEILSLQVHTKIWGTGDKYFNLAHQYYGDSQYWWVIAWWNHRPLETSFVPGDIVEVPTPLELVLEYYDIG